MVLIFDDNEFRRKEIKRALRDTEICFKIENYEHWEYLTKPIVTVFVMPKQSEIDYMVRNVSSQGTIAVSLLKREPQKSEFFDLASMGLPALHRVNSRRIDARMTEDISKADNVFLQGVIGSGEQVSKVMGKDFLLGYPSFFAEFLHITPYI